VANSPLEVGKRVGLYEGVDGSNATPRGIRVGGGWLSINGKYWALLVYSKITTLTSKTK